jgi:hypothetical protein
VVNVPRMAAPAGGHRGFEHHGSGMHHFHGHGHGRVIIAAPFILRPPIVVAPPFYLEQNPPAYIEQGTDYFYYYCPDPPGYYPDIQTCPTGWLQVVPDSVPQ